MLTPEQKAAIRAEEVFRAEIRNEIASAGPAGRHQQRRRKLWDVLNSSFVIWLLSSVVAAAISWQISQAALKRERLETQRRLRWEVYNNGKDFEHSIELAWTRVQYEAAFKQNLQNPKARVVNLEPFSFDRLTFDLESLGSHAEQNAATSARQATLDVWNRIVETKIGNSDWDKANWDAQLDEDTKNNLDKSIINTVGRRSSLRSSRNEAQLTAIFRESRLRVQQRGQFLIRTHNEPLSVAAMCISNPDCSPLRIKG
jgi:hypothetical protein